MAHKIGKESPVLCEQEVFSMDALTLAYIGDACWSFFIRKALIDTGIYNVQILNSLASEIVSARWQSRILFEIRELLNERELKVPRGPEIPVPCAEECHCGGIPGVHSL